MVNLENIHFVQCPVCHSSTFNPGVSVSNPDHKAYLCTDCGNVLEEKEYKEKPEKKYKVSHVIDLVECPTCGKFFKQVSFLESYQVVQNHCNACLNTKKGVVIGFENDWV